MYTLFKNSKTKILIEKKWNIMMRNLQSNKINSWLQAEHFREISD